MNDEKRIIDTFEARELYSSEKKQSMYSFIKNGIVSREDLSVARRRRHRKYSILEETDSKVLVKKHNFKN